MTSLPKISIVTPSYNQARFLMETLRSVKEQGYAEIEHIVVDGASTDGSVQILKECSARPEWAHLRWLSEPDRGQSNALNKGFRMATGDLVGWLNSDDTYADGCLSKVVKAFDKWEEVDVLYGDCYWIDECGRILQVRREIDFSPFILFYNRICFIQSSAALFIRRSIFDRGYFLDEDYHYSMDYEFYLRLAVEGYRFAHVRDILGSFRWHGSSKSSACPDKELSEWATAREKYAPALKRFRNRYSKSVALAVLQSTATVLRWGKKAIRGYYFTQFRRIGRLVASPKDSI